ncbi:hypothetical protein [Kordia sp.]|uniref:hypothetical protein n=1 Tax=Kordia sp. TaxID=1965332 RepID=UPI003D6A56AF
MKKRKSKQMLTFKKANIAQLNEKEIGTLNGGSSGPYTVITLTMISECTSILCTIPPDTEV